MGYQQIRLPASLSDMRAQFKIEDDFASYNDADLWTKLAADTNATVAHEGDAGKTRLKLFTGDAIKNNEAAVATTNECIKYVANKQILLEGLIEYAESNTDDACVAFGAVNALGANWITDAGAAVTATDALMIYKVDGETVWRFHTEINGSSTASTSTTTAGGTSAQTLRIEAIPRSATEFECRPYVDGVQLKTSAGVPIMHVVTLGTATDMDFGAYIKSGSGTSGQETLYVDYLHASVHR